jgi:hypothetical protein
MLSRTPEVLLGRLDRLHAGLVLVDAVPGPRPADAHHVADGKVDDPPGEA